MRTALVAIVVFAMSSAAAVAQTVPLATCVFKPHGEPAAFDVVEPSALTARPVLQPTDVEAVVREIALTDGHMLSTAALAEQWPLFAEGLREVINALHALAPGPDDTAAEALEKQAGELIVYLADPANVAHLSNATEQFDYSIVQRMMLYGNFWRVQNNPPAGDCAIVDTADAAAPGTVEIATASVALDLVTFRQRLEAVVALSKHLVNICLPPLTFPRYVVLAGRVRQTFVNAVAAASAIPGFAAASPRPPIKVAGQDVVGLSPTWGLDGINLGGWWVVGIAASTLSCQEP